MTILPLADKRKFRFKKKKKKEILFKGSNFKNWDDVPYI